MARRAGSRQHNPQSDAELRALFAGGMTNPAAIARHFGVHHQTARHWLHRLGLRVAVTHASGGDGPNVRPARRTCLKCGALFDSEGPHNRRCVSCHGREEVAIQRDRAPVDDSGYRVASVGDHRGGFSLPGGGRVLGRLYGRDEGRF